MAAAFELTREQVEYIIKQIEDRLRWVKKRFEESDLWSLHVLSIELASWAASLRDTTLELWLMSKYEKEKR